MIAVVTLATAAGWGEKNQKKPKTHSKSASPCMNSTGAQRRIGDSASQAGVGNVWHELGSNRDGGSWVLNTASDESAFLRGTDGGGRGGEDGGGAGDAEPQTVPQLQIEEG